MTAAFPLQWPQTIPRAKSREKGQFRTSLAGALANVQQNLRMFAKDSRTGLSDAVLSSNVTLGATRPADRGVAVWFVWDGDMRCITVDRYTTVEANLQAIHHVIEARRVELRHGTLALVRATFEGFRAALPPRGHRTWRAILEIPEYETPAPAAIEAAYRRLAKESHPNHGGSDAMMAELNQAKAAALREAA